ncbi:Clan CE, family C48, Ulp1-like cysteine peptidase [Trichomonas vaginalis G3]|uniref:Clan CE, family C48, Ulp1-like cysteine peptidase n=1 Tax=Trichomonas vaginalis (strain ATCC PRA-98 / G3) TaxID=412133 RepID=A2FQL9_TRIV3|nr:protease family [Trichomonas vaginalis G3]EAX92794.1 Clan CE, family C48, Ulp1-like cysteine peptidase [Trichomonas vaginalis G3]KAI5483722.1 protease family [Trichomonas vaginalis G3]|eukprot:XP_001305724.1 Clan CE, family C48, Ulp1-like cysteine peptidase [Trichomonas vaginalis G3]
MGKAQAIYHFENISIYDTDINIIKNNEWVSARLVHLAGRKIELENLTKTDDQHKNIMFYPPNTLLGLRFFPEPFVHPIVENFNVFEARYVFLPFHNGTSGSDSGSHWCLLVWDTHYSPNEVSQFYYFDSMASSTYNLAKKECALICKYYGVREFEFLEKPSPQQQNVYDCGMFMIANIEYLAKNMDFDNLCSNVSQNSVSQLRKDFVSKFVT